MIFINVIIHYWTIVNLFWMSASRLNNWNSSACTTRAGFLLMHDTFHDMNKFVIGGPLMHSAIPLGCGVPYLVISLSPCIRRLVRHVPSHIHAHTHTHTGSFSQKLKRDKRVYRKWNNRKKEIDPVSWLKKKNGISKFNLVEKKYQIWDLITGNSI